MKTVLQQSWSIPQSKFLVLVVSQKNEWLTILNSDSGCPNIWDVSLPDGPLPNRNTCAITKIVRYY